MDENKDIEVIKGNGQDLDISNVYDHIKNNSDEIDSKNNEDVVIPKSSEKKENKES